MKAHVAIAKFILILAMLLIVTGCSGLAGEPEIIATLPPATTAPTQEQAPDLGFPQMPPDLVNGAAIFEQRCTSCHGVDGRGDGELVTTGQVPNPGDFHDPTSARSQYPKQWFDTITNGKLDKLMPPWKDALTEQQRWDVALYTYTLHYTEDQFALGKILFADCAECHGEQGRGDGPESSAQRPAKDLTSQADIVTLSDQSMHQMIVDGYDNIMPSYAETFNEEERWSVVAYARSLSLQNAEQVITGDTSVVQASTPSTSNQPVTSTTLTITGNVSNLTAGGTIPAGAAIRLRVFNAANFQPLDDYGRETTLAADNTFTFPDILIESDKLYLAAMEYQGRNFASGVVQGDPTQSTLDLPIVLYEFTDDPSVVTIDASVTQIKIAEDTLEAQYAVRFTNTSDRLYSSLTADDQDRYASVYITLPPGALVVGVADQPRYVVSEDSMTVYDTLPLQPGEERFMQVTYLLQYTDGAIIEYPTPFQIKGQVRVLLQPETVTLESDQLPGHGAETLGNEVYQGYGDFLTLPADSLIRYTLNGTAGANAVVNAPNVVPGNTLVIALAGIIGLLVLGVGAWLALRGRRGLDKNQLIDALVRQIAELDAQHDAGQINHDLYRHRREQLKARLAELMDQK